MMDTWINKMTLLELITTLQKIVCENPETLKMEVYTSCSSSGVMGDDVSIFESELTESDMDASPFDDSQIGEKYIKISYD